MPDEIYRIESVRLERAKRAQTAQHVLGAFLLISGAWTHLQDPHRHHTVLAVLEIAAGALLVLSVIIEKIRHRRGAHSAIGWVEIAGAVMLTVEAINRLFERHTVALRIVSFIPPIIMLLFGIFDTRLRKLPHLRATDDFFLMRIRFITRKKVHWKDVSSVRTDGQTLFIERKDGSTAQFKMKDLKNREGAVAWAMDQFARRGF